MSNTAGKPLILNITPLPQNVQTNNVLKSFQTAEVTGIITSVTYSQRRGEPTSFRINCPNMGKTFDAVCDFFCPIRQGDTIYALCMIGGDGKLHVARPPFVQPAIDKDSMIQCFMRSLKQGYHPANKMYNTVSQIAGGNECVIPFLSGIAQSWNDTHNVEILFMFGGIDSDDVKKLLTWWHKERNLRRLYLFGLTKKEINACRMTCDEIYQRCMSNPYTVPAIPIDKCDGIMDRLNKTPEQSERIRASIIRIIWKNLHESGWTGTPTRFLSRQFPGIREHVDILKSEYGMIAEMETAYLKFPHKVETYMSEYIANKRLSDNVQYDTPIDTCITLENGTIVNRMSAHFTRDLSEDQQRAVQGALDHTLSIVTGGAGCGKCLAPGTQILMFNGQIKNIEDIKEGEYVMGPDSKARSVISTCSGYDDMFEIKPLKGQSFTCNSSHILTLTKINNEHLFDIPLNEYLNLSHTERNQYYLFHKGVDFPPKNVPLSPYFVGFWLSSSITKTQDSLLSKLRDKRIDVITLLQNLDLINNVYIPDIYKINSREIRLELLAGLIDSEVYIFNDYIALSHDDNRLSDDIEYLAYSLGFMVDRGSKIKIYGEHLNQIPLFINKNKIFQSKKSTLQSFEIIPKGNGLYHGFQLDGDGRFLLNDFLVTHNSTCIGQIIHNLELRGITYAVCAFTGKAVARIREITKKRNPATMHRLISNTRKNQLDKRSTQFEKDIPLADYEHVIIDEVSMVTTELLYDFVNAYPNIKKLTLVGDVNQLQPIGWGSLFYEILKSETIPTYTLTTNYRVYCADGERDGIILNANAIIHQDPLYPFEFTLTSNFNIIEGPIERVYDIIRGCFSSGIRSDQLVIITPYNRWLDIINRTFQDIYNVGARNVTDSRGVKWMIGDRVMLTENDQEIGVFNGESGTIRDITQKAVLVDFGESGSHEFLLEPTHDGRINYQQGTPNQYYKRGRAMDDVMDGDEGDIDDERTVKRIIHAYAMTVDKSQGSEWDFEIFFVPEFNTGSFLNKNRIYTALTRAKRAVWVVVSDIDSMNITSVKSPPYRCENLSRRLSSKLPNIKPFVISRPNDTLEMLNDLPIIPDEIYPDDAFDTGYDCDDFD